MKRLFCLTLILMLFLFNSATKVLAEDRTQNIDNNDKKVYRSAAEYNYPPFSVTDNGEANGFSVELLKAVAQESGLNISFRIDEWSVLKEELKNGQLDILPLVSYSEERDQYFDFSVLYIVMNGNIFVRKDNVLSLILIL